MGSMVECSCFSEVVVIKRVGKVFDVSQANEPTNHHMR